MDTKTDIQHICEHYALLETISSCTYLLADNYCKNTFSTLKKGGITVFRIPSIIKNVDQAIKNFLIGASFANKIQNIHHAS
jgi:predicted Fe-Mo cluster-binding NifX family protein